MRIWRRFSTTTGVRPLAVAFLGRDSAIPERAQMALAAPSAQVGGTTNHVHVLFLLGKQVNLSEIVRMVKSSTSRWINEKSGNPFRHFGWQDGYGALTSSSSFAPRTCKRA